MNKQILFLLICLFSFAAKAQGVVNEPVLGVQQVAIVPFDYLQDGNEQTIAEIEAGFFSSPYSIKNFIEEISYGKASIEGIVYPYRTNQPPLFGTGYTNCYPLDQDIVNQPDVDYSIIDGIILLVHSNTTGCGAGVSASGKLPFTTADGEFEFRRSGFRTDFYFPSDFSNITSSTVAHELIHSFGTSYHSNAYIMNDGEWKLQGYGNLFDIMGLRSQASHPCSLIKQQKGWLTDDEIENVSATGVYRIHALEQTLPGQTQALIIDLPNELDIQPNDDFTFSKLYLEYRGLTGFDARNIRRVGLSDGTNFTLEDPHGLSIVGADCSTNDDHCVPVLIDTHPEPMGAIGASYGPHEASDAPLRLGETYVVDNNPINIEVVNLVEGEYIDVAINFSVALPLNWESFTAQAQEKGKASLNWSTRNEENISHFRVERSTDGRSFTDIATQEATNTNLWTYKFIDREIPGNVAYYRIVAIGLDGAQSISPIEEVVWQAATPLVSIYPNPTDNTGLQLRWQAAVESSCQYFVYNSYGQQIRRGTLSAVAGARDETVPTHDLPGGVYFLQLRTKDWNWTGNFVIK